MELSKEFRFESAHRLPYVPEGHKCGRLHGHSYRITIHVDGDVDAAAGWVVDYADIKTAMKPLIDQLDHNFLNELPGLENPTSEVLAHWVWDRLRPGLPLLSAITVHETCTSACVLRKPA